MANTVHKKNCKTNLRNYFSQKQIVVEIFFMADNVVIFFEKKSSLQILCNKNILVKKFTCKKISKEINVRNIYVSNFLFMAKGIHFNTNLAKKLLQHNSRNKFIVKKDYRK